MKIKHLLSTCLLSVAINANAQASDKLRVPASLNSEGILFNVPLDYKIGYEAKDDKQHLTELVLKNETVDDWSEMISYLIFLNQAQIPIERIYKAVEQSILNGCQSADIRVTQTGKTHGYDFMDFQQVCPKNPRTNKPEYTAYKLVRGKQHTYLLHMAFTSQPKTTEQLSKIESALDKVQLCSKGKTGKACFVVDQK